MFSVVTVFIALWGVSFIMVTRHISMTEATFICDMAFIGVAIGCPIFGYLDSIVHHRRRLLLTSCFCGLAMFSIVIFIPMNTVLSVICMILLGMSCSSYMIPFAIANEISPENLRGAAMGFVNTISVGTAPILQPLVGYILYKVSSKHLLQQHHHLVDHYSAHDFHVALSVMLFVFIISAVIAWFLPSRKVVAE